VILYRKISFILYLPIHYNSIDLGSFSVFFERCDKDKCKDIGNNNYIQNLAITGGVACIFCY
jgi:hypothetical protein